MSGSGHCRTEQGSMLEASAAALAGFLAGGVLDAEWPLFEALLRLLFGY